MPKTHYKKELCNVLLEKLMVHNGILMKTNGISVMVSIGLLLFFLAGRDRQDSLRYHKALIS